MHLVEYFLNIRNQADFFIRSRMRWKRPLPVNFPISSIDSAIQMEIKAFLSLFDWETPLSRLKSPSPLILADIGARNFAFAPMMEAHFRSLGYAPEIHGIEVDAYRRFTNLHTRADYGEFFAQKIARGFFHPINFLTWHHPLHIGFLLNPFVNTEEILSWGLPLSELKPREIFQHAYDLVKPYSGFVVLSNPCVEEQAISYKIAQEIGFRFGQACLWNSDDPDRHPRYGVILHS